MGRTSRRFLCLFLSVIVMMGFTSIPVFASDGDEITFNDHGIFEKDIKAGTSYFNIKVDGATGFYFTLGEIEGSKIQVELWGDNLYGSICDENRYDAKPDIYGCYQFFDYGKVTCELKVTCTKDTKFKVLCIDGAFYQNVEGDKQYVYLNPAGPTEYNQISVPQKGTGTLQFESRNSKQNVSLYYGNQKVDGINFKEGEEKDVKLVVEGYEFIYKAKSYTIAHLKYDCDTLRNYLVEKGSSIDIPFPNSNDTPDNEKNALTRVVGKKISWTEDPVTTHLNDIQNSFIYKTWICQEGSEKYISDMVYAKVCIFVKDTSHSNKLTLNKEEEVNSPFGNGTMDTPCYEFTPEKDGIYTCTSKGKYSNPYVAVFDSDDNCIGWYDNSINDFECKGERDYQKKIAEKGIDYHLNLKVDLKAGKTYYFYFANSGEYTDAYAANPEQDVFKVNLTYEPYPPTPDPVITEPEITDEMSFEDFVERLYVVALNRPSEKEGKDYWCELVGNGTLTGADCARFFLTSPEFKGRNLSDEDFLKVLYKTFFDRDAKDDPDGFNFWMNSLKSVGKDTVVEGFINSPEWCDICATYGVKSGAPTAKATKASKNATAFATRLYTECLGREPEEGGLKYWSLGLTNLELTGSQAAHEFFYCKEFNDHNFDNKELLTRMYRTFMGREPDTDGLNYWLGNMNNGMTKDQVFNSFVQSQEFTEICANYAIDR